MEIPCEQQVQATLVTLNSSSAVEVNEIGTIHVNLVFHFTHCIRVIFQCVIQKY